LRTVLSFLLICVISIFVLAGCGQESNMSSKEKEYISTLTTHSQEVGTTLTKLGELLQSPRIGQDDWTIAVVSQIVTLDNLTKEANGFPVPDTFKDVHGYYLLAMDEFAEVAKQLPKAIDNLDSSMMETVAIHMNQGLSYIEKATKLLNEKQNIR